MGVPNAPTLHGLQPCDQLPKSSNRGGISDRQYDPIMLTRVGNSSSPLLFVVGSRSREARKKSLMGIRIFDRGRFDEALKRGLRVRSTA
jgi:hypothetical protein